MQQSPWILFWIALAAVFFAIWSCVALYIMWGWNPALPGPTTWRIRPGRHSPPRLGAQDPDDRTAQTAPLGQVNPVTGCLIVGNGHAPQHVYRRGGPTTRVPTGRAVTHYTCTVGEGRTRSGDCAPNTTRASAIRLACSTSNACFLAPCPRLSCSSPLADAQVHAAVLHGQYRHAVWVYPQASLPATRGVREERTRSGGAKDIGPRYAAGARARLRHTNALTGRLLSLTHRPSLSHSLAALSRTCRLSFGQQMPARCKSASKGCGAPMWSPCLRTVRGVC